MQSAALHATSRKKGLSSVQFLMIIVRPLDYENDEDAKKALKCHFRLLWPPLEILEY